MKIVIMTYKKNFNHSLIVVLSILIVGQFFSCQDFVEIDPPITEQAAETIFTSDATANAVIIGIYSRMMESRGFASGNDKSITLYCGISADELDNFRSSNNEFWNNALSTTNGSLRSFLWQEPYKYISTANAVLEGLSKSEEVTDGVKKQLEGESRFIRAFCYFYLVNLFGDVPLYTSTDFRLNSVSSRTSQLEIYQQIIMDLEEAKNLLADDYSFSGGERVRPNQSTATALLARTFLYMEKWKNAETQTTDIINNTTYELVADLNKVFLANSPEAIWQLRPVQPGYNTNEGRIFILIRSPRDVALSDQLISSFETDDKRQPTWINSFTDEADTWHYPYKYKIRTGDTPLEEYSMVFRLAEQYLIRAEARVEQGNISGAQADLNTIRNRAGLTNTTAMDQVSILAAIEQERKIELFAEWGHRWLDLKRTNHADDALSLFKSPNWQPTDVLYPIPELEITNNPNITQNEGY